MTLTSLYSPFADTQTSHRKKAKGQHAKEKKSEDSTVCMNTAGQRESEVKTAQIEGHGKMIRGHTQDEAHQQQVDPHPTKTASQPTNFPKQLKHMMSQTSKKTNVDSGRNEKEKGTQEHMFDTHRTNTDKHDGEWS